jgi:dienelactone hydrolase
MDTKRRCDVTRRVRRAAVAAGLVLLLSGCAGIGGDGVGGREALQAEIRKDDLVLQPAGPGPFPAVIMLHGCSGLGSRDRMWAARLRAWGYLTLRVNSFAARGLKNVCGGGVFGPDARVPDVLAALAYLRTRTDVDAPRIELMGWSHGAMATLMTLGAAPEEPAAGFRAAVAYYPGCRQVHGWRTRTPVLMLLGGADDWTAASPCQYLASRQRQAGLDVTQVTYPGAHHGFDNPLLGPNPRRIPEALGGRGATTQYDPAGAEDSVRRVREFLARHLGGRADGQAIGRLGDLATRPRDYSEGER